MSSMIERSLIVPVYKNEENITDLVKAVQGLAERIDALETIFVVDGSPDDSHTRLAELLPTTGLDVQLLEHSRNFGSFAAIRTGMAAARGETIAVMAADLQEPPSLIEEFFEILTDDRADIVFGTRSDRGDPLVSRVLSSAFWSTYRRFVVPDIPRGGVDVFACNSNVAREILAMPESNSSLVSQLFWVGFRRSYVPYERRQREKGASAWSLRRRLRYMADSIFSFSDLPILALVWVGLIGLVFSGLLGIITLAARLAGAIDEPGFATILIAVLFLFSVLIASQGIVGMYLWRAFENGKGRPSAIVMHSDQFSSTGHARSRIDTTPSPQEGAHRHDSSDDPS